MVGVLAEALANVPLVQPARHEAAPATSVVGDARHGPTRDARRHLRRRRTGRSGAPRALRLWGDAGD
eukprot:3075687-Prymnesium_polylepis.1